MKMDEFKKLFKAKRILALALAAAMTVTELPATALAAEAEAETQTEVQAETETAGTEKELAAADDADADSQQTKESAAQEQEENDIPAQGQEGNDIPAQGQEEDGTPVETQESQGTAGSQTAEDMQTADKSTYVLDISALTEEDKTKEYSRYGNLFGENQNDVSYEIREKIKITDGTNDYTIGGIATVTWQKNDGTPLDSAPMDVGTYKLEISIAADDTHNEFKESVDGFTIKPAAAAVEFEMDAIAPGTSINPDAIKEKVSSLTAVSGDGKTFRYLSQETETEKSDLSIANVTVIDSLTGAATTDKEFARNKDYRLKIEVAFTASVSDADKKNYVLEQCVDAKNLTIGDLAETKVQLALKADKWPADKVESAELSDGTGTVSKITKAYDTNAFPALVKDTDYTAEVQEKDKLDDNGAWLWKAVSGAATTGEWHSAEYKSWKETEKDSEGNDIVVTRCNLTVGGKLTSHSDETGKDTEYNPVDAGTYVYRVVYSGTDERYAGSYADIVVEIETVEAVIRPTVKNEGEKFCYGETVKNVLGNIKYDVYDVTDTKHETSIKDKVNWGTSYDQSGKTQPYEPVFAVYKIVKKGDAVIEETLLEENDTLKAASEGTTVTYEVRATGMKAVYGHAAGDQTTEQCGLNEAVDSHDSNYVTLTDEDILKANAYTLTVDNTTMNKIVTDDITKEGLVKAGNKLVADKDFAGYEYFTKTYDGKPLFDSRDEYKKAKIDGEQKGTLTYTWYKKSGNYKVAAGYVINEGYGIADKNEFDSDWDTISGDFDTEVKKGLTNAGIYKLVIRYTDNTGATSAEPATLYYVINPVEIKVGLGKVPDVYGGTTVNDYIDKEQKNFNPELKCGEENWKYGIAEDTWEPDDADYTVEWKVERKDEITNEDGSKEFEWNWVYGNSSFIYNAETPQEYRLAVDSITIRSYKDRNPQNYTWESLKVVDVPAETEGGEPTKDVEVTPLSATSAITVKKAGETALVIDNAGIIEVTKTYDGKVSDEMQNKLKEVKLVKSGDETKAPVTDASLTFTWKVYKKGKLVEIDPAEAVNAGTYRIYARFDGNDTYLAVAEEQVATLTIEQAVVTVTPKLDADYKIVAGSDIYSVNEELNLKDNCVVDAANVPAEEKAAFTWRTWTDKYGNEHTGYEAWTRVEEEDEAWPPSFRVYNDEVEYDYDSKVKSAPGKNSIGISDECLASPYDTNYSIEYGMVPVETVYGNSRVEANVAILDSAAADRTLLTHDITFNEGIPYTSITGSNGEEVYGNLVRVFIQAPDEFDSIPDTAFYENAIKNAGALTVSDDGSQIIAVFDAAEDTEDGKRKAKEYTFQISWKEGYVETFILKPADENLCGDLRQAVAPKSLAFNTPKTKMVVGEVQDLDVKVTKVENSDIICLKYDVLSEADKEYVSVSEQGRVTALNYGGTATVVVYPVKVVNNKKIKIEGAKAAQVKITVSEVTAPKITKVIPYGTKVNVQYPYTADNNGDYGYRREIYVMKGDKVTKDEFEDAIGSIVNNNWEAAGFAVAPKFLNNADELSNRIWDSKKSQHINTVSVDIGVLDTKSPYTVYVRNVSAARTLGDGNKVVLSGNGTVKGFTTTLAQVEYLELSADEEHYNEDKEIYEYDLLEDGSATVTAKGMYMLSQVEENKNAESRDHEWVDVPFAKEEAKALKAKYVEPKLEYKLYHMSWDGEREYGTEAKYAKVDKKGKITFQQPERIAVYVGDTTTGIWSDKIEILVTAKADSIAGKSVTLQVGQRVPLETLVTYKAGKKMLDSLNDAFLHEIEVTKELKSAFGNDFEVDQDGYVTALKEVKTPKEVTLKDRYITDSSAPVKIKVKPLDPVKNLKLFDMVDDKFYVDFVPSIYADAYRVDVYNSRMLIKSVYETVDNYDEYGRYLSYYKWDSAKKAYVGLTNPIEINGLTAQSKYNVKVTALFRDQKSKEAAKAVSTTKLPASDYGLAVGQYNGQEYDDESEMSYYVGMPVTTFDAYRRYADNMWYDGEDYGYEGFNPYYDIAHLPFYSGNRYTLIALPDNIGAQYAVTDKLTWTSSNGKVATVKAVGGSYSATLKALRAGTTKIEVKSGITKKVIARYTLTVRTVGDAYNFYDENEPLRGDGTPGYRPRTDLVLNVPVAVELTAGQTQQFTFVAAEAGTYNLYKIVKGNKSFYNNTTWAPMQKNEKKLVNVSGPLSGTIVVEKEPETGWDSLTELKLGRGIKTSTAQYFVFTAPEEGLYSFEGINLLYTEKNGSPKSDEEYTLKANQTVYLYGDGGERNVVRASKIKINALGADTEYTVPAGTTLYYRFKVPADGKYAIIPYNAHAYIQNEDDGWDEVVSYNYNTENLYDADKELFIKVKSYSENASIKVETKFTVNALVLGTDTPVELRYDTQNYNYCAYYTFTPSEAGFYTFTAENLYKNVSKSLTNWSGIYLDNESYYLNGNEKLYLRLSSSNEVSDAKVKVEKDTTKEAPVQLPSGDIELPASGEKCFTFKTKAATRYEFSVEGYASLTCCTDLNTNNNFGTSKYFEEETIVYLKLSSNTGSAVTVKVKAEEVKPTALTEETIATLGKVPACETKWFAYTADEDNKYEFTAAAADDNSYSVSVDAFTENQFKGIYKDAESNENLMRGQRVYLRIENSGEKEVTLKVAKEIQKIENGSKITKDSDDTTVKFNAPKTGIYTFELDTKCRSFRLFSKWSSDGVTNEQQYDSNGKKLCHPLTEGETVYIMIQGSSYGDYTFDITCEEMTEIAVGANPVSVTAKANEKNWICFKMPSDSGDYSYFSINCNGEENRYEELYYRYTYTYRENNWKENGYFNEVFVYLPNGSNNFLVYSSDAKIVCMYLEPNSDITFDLSIEKANY